MLHHLFNFLNGKFLCRPHGYSPSLAMGDDFGDCSTDGTCEGESGPGGLPKVPIPGVKFASTTLMEESESAVQQFALA